MNDTTGDKTHNKCYTGGGWGCGGSLFIDELSFAMAARNVEHVKVNVGLLKHPLPPELCFVNVF